MKPTQADPKAGERAYYARLNPAELRHAVNKPFSDPDGGKYLSDFGALLQMLPRPPARVLDLGCGTGWTTRFLARAGYQVTGIDISEDAIREARAAASERALPNLSFRVSDYEALGAAADYDIVLFYDALHHAENETLALTAAYRALVPGGVLFAFEPGVGHSRSHGAIAAVKTFQVHEKDMPPRYVWRLGRKVGFRRVVFLPSPHEFTRSVYRRDYFEAQSSFGLLLEKAWGYWRALTKVVRARSSGVIVMWK